MKPIALITGTTHGIGLVTACELARANYTVVMACRDLARASEIAAEIRAAQRSADVHSLHCDLASLASVRNSASEFLDRFPALHVLINNAGLMCTKRDTTEDGFEMMFGVNHLGPFLLTNLLLDRIRESAPARIVNVASQAHLRGHLDFDDLQAERRFSAMRVYGNSKLANVMFTLALARRLEGSGVSANCLHPGVVGTNIFPRDNFFFRAVAPIARRFLMSPEDGARTTLHLAQSDAVAEVSGAYFDEAQRLQAPASEAANEQLQEQLWRVSASLTGLGDL